MRFWRLLLIGLLLMAAGLPAHTWAAPVPAPVLDVAGLDDNAVVRDTVGVTVTVDGDARTLVAYTNLLPWLDTTSHSVGVWRIRGGNTLRLRIDTRYLPEGPQALVFFTRDVAGRMHAMRAFSIRVHNRAATPEDPASHIEIKQPVHGEVLKGSFTIDVRRFDTGKVARIDYLIDRLGDRWIDWSSTLPDAYFDIRNLPAGVYAVNALARNAGGEIIDRSIVTVVVPARNR